MRQRSYELAVQLQDTWGQASAAQGLTQLHSQLAHRRRALEWAARAEAGFIHAPGRQRPAPARLADRHERHREPATSSRGRPILERFATETDDSLGFDFLDLRAIGRERAGRDRPRDRARSTSGLRQYREAVAVFATPGTDADALAEHRRRRRA